MPSRFWILFFFFFSGITGLLYEVVWARLFTLVMGNSHYSISTVLTAFMGGLALGSFIGGRLIDKTDRPLRWYAFLELAIGIFCLLVPFFIDFIQPILKSIYTDNLDSYVKASFLRFLVCSTILIIPTTFMGATLPVLGKFISCNPSLVGREVGSLYAINTFGAVVGALSSAFVLMPLLGLRGTLWTASLVNVVIGILILVGFKEGKAVANTQSVREELESEKGEISSGLRWIVLTVFSFSGVCGLIYQVAWNRIFSLALGSSVYAFSLIVTTFILGLALGAMVFSKWCDGFSDRLYILGLLQAGVGIFALILLPLYGKIPFLNRLGYEVFGATFITVQWTNFGIIFFFLFLPTFMMGGQFPVVVKLIARNFSRVGNNIGNAYAFNTVGAIIGSFVGGFILIPLIGIQKTILVAVFLNLAIGLGLLIIVRKVSFNFKVYVIPAIAIICLVFAQSIPEWDKAIISSGSYMPYRIKDLDEAIRKTNRVLFYREGLHTTVTTELSVSGNIFLRVNGKTDASLALDMRTQLLSGYLPMFLHEGPDSVLVIGQGSGITLGAVEQFPSNEIDLVEISDGVIEGSRYFDPFNHFALDDQRLKIFLEDGRNHVALTDKRYDVIISEPSNPWISGVGTLFTLEFFQLLRDRLEPGGIACIWVHTNMSPESFKSIVKTYRQVFPKVVMWESIIGDDYLLIGSEKPYRLRYEEVQKYLEDPKIAMDMKKIGIHEVKDLMSLFLMSGKGLDNFSADAPIHTDDNLLLEFRAPAYIYKDERSTLVRELAPHFKIDTNIVSFRTIEDQKREEIQEAIARLKRSESQVEEIKRKARAQGLLEAAEEDFNAGRLVQAEQKYAEILMLEPDHVLAYLNIGKAYQAQDKIERAEWAYRKTIEINPFYVFGSIALAKLHIASGRYKDAIKTIEKLKSWYSKDAEAHVYLGLAYSFLKKNKQAEKAFKEALKLDPLLPQAHYYSGLYFAKNQPSQASKHLKKFLKLGPNVTSAKLIHNAKNLLNKLESSGS